MNVLTDLEKAFYQIHANLYLLPCNLGRKADEVGCMDVLVRDGLVYPGVGVRCLFELISLLFFYLLGLTANTYCR